ncbi:MAG: 30S ribosomal protein S12 methylthiotransferase RimO [Desulfobulbaceae bacterium]|nr:30S ribosomal protein S12 methylthiotransferase RimO [Desulfobulbaceae bacterium]
MMTKNVFIVSLGCPKNLVDSEVMLGTLALAGYKTCATPEEAQVLLVNTCGFIQSAAEEAVDEILRLAAVKTERPGTRLVVTGCLVQRYGEDLKKALPEVDLFLGTENFFDIATRIAALGQEILPAMADLSGQRFLMDSSMPRLISTPSHRAYLKITEGCSNACSYCMIPAIRGRLRSRRLDDVISEAQKLAQQGVKELTLIGQDLTAYGLDLGASGPRLVRLLNHLLSQTTIPWLRMLYLYPHRITEDLLQVIAENPRLLPYLDIPLQHVSPNVLRLMNRPFAKGALDELFAKIRRILPHAAIRTTFIVGFPGETEADVKLLEEFMRTYRLDHVGVFAYSDEEGSAAAKLPEHCSAEVKEEREQRLMELQAEISLAKNQALVGRKVQVLVEGVSAETDLLLEGRLASQAPDIDGCVYITSGECAVGDIVDLMVTEAHTYDVVGEIIEADDESA